MFRHQFLARLLSLVAAVALSTTVRSAPPQEPSKSTKSEEMNQAVKQATAVRDRHMTELFKLPAVTGAGIGFSKQTPPKVVIDVFVTRPLTENEQSLFPKELEGVPVRIVETGVIRPLESGGKSGETENDRPSDTGKPTEPDSSDKNKKDKTKKE